MNAQVTAAITSIGEESWTPIRYPNAVYDQAEGRWVSDAEIAEIPLVVFTSRRKADHVPCRLVVRRVKRLQPLAGDGTAQGELFATYRHHAFSPTPRGPRWRPTPGTATMRSSSGQSPSSRTARWRICRWGPTRRTPPDWRMR
jgi:hypothetical protein